MGTQKCEDELTCQERHYAELLRFMSDEHLVGFYSSSEFDNKDSAVVALMADEAVTRLEKRAHRDRVLVECLDEGRITEAFALLINETKPERVEDELSRHGK